MAQKHHAKCHYCGLHIPAITFQAHAIKCKSQSPRLRALNKAATLKRRAKKAARVQKAPLATIVAKPSIALVISQALPQKRNRSRNAFVQRELRLGRRESLEDLAIFIKDHPLFVAPGLVAAACNVSRATVRKAVLNKDIAEARFKIGPRRLVVLVSLIDALKHFA